MASVMVVGTALGLATHHQNTAKSRMATGLVVGLVLGTTPTRHTWDHERSGYGDSSTGCTRYHHGRQG